MKVQFRTLSSSKNIYHHHVVLIAQSILTLSLFPLHLYHSSFLADTLDKIRCPRRADVCKLLMKESIGERRLRVRPYFSSNAQHVSFVYVRLVAGGHTIAVLWSTVSRICLKQLVALLCGFYLAFFSKSFINVLVVQPYSFTDSATATATAWKKSRFIIIWEIIFPHDWQPINSSLCLPYTYVDITFSRWDIAAEVCELVY